MTVKKLSKSEAMEKIQAAVKAGRIKYQCVFCHGDIEGSVHALIFVAKWNGLKPRSQQWFTHDECFIKATGETVDVLRND